MARKTQWEPLPGDLDWDGLEDLFTRDKILREVSVVWIDNNKIHCGQEDHPFIELTPGDREGTVHFQELGPHGEHKGPFGDLMSRDMLVNQLNIAAASARWRERRN